MQKAQKNPKIGAKTRFQALDGWRGVCALLVALDHIPIKVSVLGLAFFNDAYLFVDFFFVLSGFVIAHSYGSTEGIETNWLSFCLKRFGRLWPLHMSVFLLFLSMNVTRLALFGWYGDAIRAAASWHGLLISASEQITLLQAASFLPREPGILINGPSWSISTEFWTYLLFALITSTFRRNALIVKGTLVLVSSFVVVHFASNGMDAYNWVGFFRCFYGFFLGQLVYAFYAARPHGLGFIKASIFEGAMLIVAIAFVAIARRSPLSFCAPIIFAGVVYCFAADAGAFSGWLKTRPIQALGNYSYSIYMIHALFITATCGMLHIVGKLLHRTLIISDHARFRIEFGPPWMMVGFAGLILFVAVSVSSVTYRVIEKPGQRFFSRLARRVQEKHIHPKDNLSTEGAGISD